MPIGTTSLSQSSSFSSSLPPSLPTVPPELSPDSSAPSSCSSSPPSSPTRSPVGSQTASPTVSSPENVAPITFIEIIKGSPDLELLKDFYDTFLAIYFPFSSELSSWTDWIRFASSSMNETESHGTRIDLLVILARQQTTMADPNSKSNGPDSMKTTTKTVGGVVLEYYPQSNCGLISYVVVDPELRGAGLGRKLINEGIDQLQKQARRRKATEGNVMDQNRSGCVAIFSEMNSPDKIDKDVIAPFLRAQLFHRLNFALLDIKYIQPALESHLPYCDDLVLLVHLRSLCPEAIVPPTPGAALSSSDPVVFQEKTFNREILFEFLKEVWLTLKGVNPECHDMVDAFRSQLDGLPQIKLLSLAERFKYPGLTK